MYVGVKAKIHSDIIVKKHSILKQNGKSTFEFFRHPAPPTQVSRNTEMRLQNTDIIIRISANDFGDVITLILLYFFFPPSYKRFRASPQFTRPCAKTSSQSVVVVARKCNDCHKIGLKVEQPSENAQATAKIILIFSFYSVKSSE